MTSVEQRARQRQRDYTQGNLTQNIWDLSWPSIVSMAFFSIPNTLDGIWLGRLGSEALAAAGIGMALRITMISPLMALSAASGAVVARYVGSKDQQRANQAVLQAVILFAVTAASIGLFGLAFTEELVRLAGGSEEALPLAVSYVRLLFIGLVAMELVPSIGAMLVAAGSADLSLRVNLLVSAVILALEPFLVLGWGPFPRLGVVGGSLSFVIGNTCGMLYALYLLLTRQAPVWIDTRHLVVDWSMIRRIVRIALPAVVQRGTPNLAQTILIRLISVYGSVPVAVYSIVMRVLNLALIPSLGTSRSAAALVGQNLGAQRPERAERAAMTIVAVVSVVSVALLATASILSTPILSLFSDEPDVIAQGVHAIPIIAFAQFFFAISMAFDNSLAGAGDTMSPMVVNTIVLWLVQLPIIYLFSQLLGWRVDGIWRGIVVGQITLAALMTWRFRQGRWKSQEI